METDEVRKLFKQLESLKEEYENLQNEIASGPVERSTWDNLEDKKGEIEEIEKLLAGVEINDAERMLWSKELRLEREAEEQRDKLMEQIIDLRQQGVAAKDAGNFIAAADLFIKAFELTYDRVKPNEIFWAATGSEAVVAGDPIKNREAKAMIATWKMRKGLLRDLKRAINKMPRRGDKRDKYIHWLEKILSVPHDTSTTKEVLGILEDIGDEKTAGLMLRYIAFDPLKHTPSSIRAFNKESLGQKTGQVYIPEELLVAEWWITINILWQRLKPPAVRDFLTKTAKDDTNEQNRFIAKAILDEKRLRIRSSTHGSSSYLAIE